MVRRPFDLLWKLKRALQIGSEKVLAQNVAVIDRYAAQFIARRRENIKVTSHKHTLTHRCCAAV